MRRGFGNEGNGDQRWGVSEGTNGDHVLFKLLILFYSVFEALQLCRLKLTSFVLKVSFHG
jgi:hypothetical protein